MAAREKPNVTLLFADLDELKPINDELGHAVGDQALVETAELLSRVFRAADAVARIGGDEFAVLMVVHPRVDAERLVKRRLLELLSERNAQPNRAYTLSLSVGVVTRPAVGAKLEELLADADKLMYQVKRTHTGRGVERVPSD